MNITIIGWYGTETIGDRAILAGIISFLNNSFNNIKINLGSLYPFFTERTLIEDNNLYSLLFSNKISINLFNSKNPHELEIAIRNSNILIMGGGPLMHIGPLYMIDYAFKYAKKQRKRTIIFGCGIGPIFKMKYKKVLISIINDSDLIILRDSISKQNLINISKELNFKLQDNIFVSLDPAVKCCIEHLKLKRPISTTFKGNYIAVNLREFPSEYSLINKKQNINKFLEKFIVNVSNKFINNEIILVPMHYFVIGNDDRAFLNRIAINNKLKNVYIQNKPLSLQETMRIFQYANINFGMRFHSVLFQTLLNGNNYILDYTEPRIGKISGFVNDINGVKFYKNRYINLQTNNLHLNISKRNKLFKIDHKMLNNKLSIYINEMSLLEI